MNYFSRIYNLLGLPDPVGFDESINLDLPGLKNPAGFLKI